MQICTAPNFGLIFETHQGRERNTRNITVATHQVATTTMGDQGELIDEHRMDSVYRQTDMRYFDGNILSGPNARNWKCSLCNYTRDKHQRYQVFCHATATHGYTSRTPNEGRGIQIHDKYSDEPETNQPQERKPYMAAEIDNRRIQIR